MQFGFFNHRFSSYSAAVRFPATKVCSTISASNSTQQASSCACDRRAEENNKLHNGKPELMSSIVPPCCGCFPGQLHSVDIMGQKYPQMGYNPLCVWVCVCVFMRAHTEFQVCLASHHLIWNTETCDSPTRFPKWVWRSAGKLSQGQQWLMERMADHWGVWCSAGIVCYCVIVTSRDVKVGLFECFHKESPSSLCAGLSHFVDNHAPIVKCIFTYTQCHMPDNMEANLTVLARSHHFSPTQKSNKQSHAAGQILKIVHL